MINRIIHSHQSISLQGFPSLRDLELTAHSSSTRQLREEISEIYHLPPTSPIVSALLGAVSLSLQTIELSASLTGFHTIASLEWPHLHSFTLTGGRPSFSHMELASVVGGMPNLRILEIRLLSEPSPYILQRQSSPPARSLSELLPHLQTLVISNVQSQDIICSFLPMNIQSFSIRCSPDLEGYNHRRAVSTSLSPQRTFEIVKTVGSQHIRLRTLALDLDEIPSVALVEAIALHVPTVQFLELKQHDFYDIRNSETLVSDLFCSHFYV